MPPFPDFPELLAGPVAGLRLAAERDIPEILIAHQDDQDLHRRLGLDRPPSGAQLGRRTETAAAAREAGAGLWLTVLAVGDRAADECRGQLEVHDVSWDQRTAELDVWIALRDRGRGLAAGALELAGRWLIERAAIERVQLLIDPGNAAMLGAAGQAGFQREGVLRGYLEDRGRRIDAESVALVRGDLR